jgi:uncharacterized protein (TIGR03083 family)
VDAHVLAHVASLRLGIVGRRWWDHHMPDHQRAIAAESDRFRAAICLALPDARVPTCPDWSADDLLWHLTGVHAFWAGILRSGAVTDPEAEAVDAAKPDRPGARETLLTLFDQHTEALLSELARLPDDRPAWFWLEPAKTVGSTRRMQAHEALMHRIDAELAAGKASAPIEPELAADGVTHALEVMWVWWGTQPGFRFQPVARPALLSDPDRGESWLVQSGRWVGVGESGEAYDVPGAVPATSGEPAAFVRGSAEALDRWLWGRGPEPDSSGDPASLAALREARSQGMQ